MEEKDKFSSIKKNVQEIINLIGAKNHDEAYAKLQEVSEQLTELLDYSTEDEALIEISRYQTLLIQLNQRIIALNGNLKP